MAKPTAKLHEGAIPTLLPRTHIVLSLVFIVVLISSVLLDILPLAILIFYSVISAYGFALYGWDKFCAKKSLRRIREKTLHIIDAVGGWPGAAAAQTIFHHKTNKRSFQQGYWISVVVNASVFALLYTPPGQQWLLVWVPFLQDFIAAVFS